MVLYLASDSFYLALGENEREPAEMRTLDCDRDVLLHLDEHGQLAGIEVIGLAKHGSLRVDTLDDERGSAVEDRRLYDTIRKTADLLTSTPAG